MNKRGHMIGCGVLSGIAVVTANFELIPGIILGSFIPDLDCRSGSYIRYKLRLLSKFYDMLPYCKLFGRKGYKHRSLLLHSIWTVIILTVAVNHFNSKILLGLLIGVLSHHMLDSIELKKYIFGG